MMLSHSVSLFYPPMKPQPGVGKYCSKKNVASHIKRNGFISKNDVVVVPAGLRCELDTMNSSDHQRGIGILEFFQGKNILVTGATGLLGKVVVEKILRSTPVGKVYVLIKAKHKEAALDRLESEIIKSELFTCLQEKYGKYYESFVREKLIAIVGDICKPNLGMDHDSINAVRKDVDVIIQSAACTAFNERYDLMVEANVIAPQRVLRFAKTCRKLQLFTHVSTAFVNGDREGVIFEKPLIMGATGRILDGDAVGVDVADEISLLLNSSTPNANATKYFKNLGRHRAEKFGWSTTYQLSKSMGEMVVNEMRQHLPLLIIRPAIIQSCYRQPLPGWIQGYRMFDPVAISYGKGIFPALVADPHVALDLIPADMVANTMIAAIAKHGKTQLQDDDEVNVYHVASANSNPVTIFHAFEYLYECFHEAPLTERANIERLRFFDNFPEFLEYTREQIFQCSGGDAKMIRQCNAKVEYAQKLCKTYEFAAFCKARFHTGNTLRLHEEMSKEEQLNFDLDVKNIDWKMYFQDIYVPGLRKHIC